MLVAPPAGAKDALTIAGVGDVAAWPASSASQPNVFAVVQRGRCAKNCNALVTPDPSGTWVPLAARGWNGGAVSGVSLRGRPAVLSANAKSLQISTDDGGTFRSIGRGGALATASPGAPFALASGDDGAGILYAFDNGAARVIPPVKETVHVSYALTPDFPGGSAPVVLAGSDRSRGRAVVALCDARVRCGPVQVITQHPDVARAYISPSFLKDRLIVLTLVKGGLRISRDGGTSFLPSAVPIRLGNGQRSLIETVQDVAFDDTTSPATIYLGIVGATIDSKGNAQSTGAVWRSGDAGLTWAATPSDADLAHGVNAIAVSRGTVIAGFINAFGQPRAGLRCLVPGGSWGVACQGVWRNEAAAITSGAQRGTAGRRSTLARLDDLASVGGAHDPAGSGSSRVPVRGVFAGAMVLGIAMLYARWRLGRAAR